jgi:outer membrane protein
MQSSGPAARASALSTIVQTRRWQRRSKRRTPTGCRFRATTYTKEMVAAVVLLAARLLTLADAIRIAEERQPQLRVAHANTEIALARVGEARSAILPQLVGAGSYQRTTANFVPRPSVLPQQIVNMGAAASPSFTTFNFFDFALTLNQYLWDFRAPFLWSGTKATAEAQAASERSTHVQVLLNVRVAFFNARAQKALADVARNAVANQKKHRDQIRGFVEVGRQPEIALAQAETDYANSEVALINAENAYLVGKVQLNQAMGTEGTIDYEIVDEAEPAVDGEDDDIRALFSEGLKARPDLTSLEKQIRAQHLTLSAAKGGWGPTFSASMQLSDAGTSVSDLVWNWNVTVNTTWTLFDGLLIYSQVKGARANEQSLEAQRDALRQQILVDVSQAALSVRATKATLTASAKAVTNAHLQLQLAEGRFTEGAGNVIELSDAQLAYTQADAQRVQAEYNLATARAQLLRALGRTK